MRKKEKIILRCLLFFPVVALFVTVCLWGCANKTVNPVAENSGYHHPVIMYTSDFGNTWDMDTIRQESFSSESDSYFSNFIVVTGAYCVLYNGALWYSDVNSKFETWSSALTVVSDLHIDGLASSNGIGYAWGWSAQHGFFIFKSPDGFNWQQIYNNNTDRYYNLDVSGYNLAAVGTDHILSSANGGVTWDRALVQGNNTTLNHVKFIGNSKVLCTNVLGDVFMSTNSGTTWSPRSNIPAPTGANDFNLSYSNSIILVLNKEQKDLYKSSDEGQTWTQLQQDLNANKLVFNNNICAGLGNGFYKTPDFGQSWSCDSLHHVTLLGDIFFQDDGQFGYITGGIEE